MHLSRIAIAFMLLSVLHAAAQPKSVTIRSAGISLQLMYSGKASIASLSVNGQKVIDSPDGVFTSIKLGGTTYSSLQLTSTPVLTRSKDTIRLSGIRYGDARLTISEVWTFTTTHESIGWNIRRSLSRALPLEASESPVFQFDDINTWEGAYQGYGGLAWFYLFNEKLCTYGVHTRVSNFWNSKTGNGFSVSVDAPGKQVAMRYTRTLENRLAYAITVSDQAMVPRFDSGTNRRRYIRGRTDVWAPFTPASGESEQRITLRAFDFNERYGRGQLAGVNGQAVGAVLNTIARIGVIDSLHFGGNSWHTPYGPICLHEQYIAQLGLAIDDPAYLKGYQSCLDYYRDHAIEPDGRVFARWAYSDEDMMPGQGNKEGFYEAQWGFLMDSNPDLVSNVSDLYDLTGDKAWVQRHQLSCERALDWILRRDSNGNGLVEMMTDSEKQHRGSDWIDIIWASYENAFVNAKLYHALVKWAAIERQLGNSGKAAYYEDFGARLKTSFNKPVDQGGFWDAADTCYVHWLDRDKSAHGRNMVTPVNFMAIAYGLCDDPARSKAILDKIEMQMEREHLFFWPLAMTSYAAGEGRSSQFPFPAYENGDLFLSWGSIAVKAYADYDPALALRYVRNVLDQYSKDGLAFQRYGRLHQEGLGDDILSGNSLAIVGLYQAIYGINPLYNRFYLDPHITPELAGTRLKYNFRGQRLTILLDTNHYSVSDAKFTVVSPMAFGFCTTKNEVSYFHGNSSTPSLEATSENALTLAVTQWSDSAMAWTQTAGTTPARGTPPATLRYRVSQLSPYTTYALSVADRPFRHYRSDLHGELSIQITPGSSSENINLTRDR
jgi:hypothetical protein